MKGVVRLSKILANVVTWALAIVWALPVVGLIMVSVRPFSEVVVHGWWTLQGHFNLNNYVEVLFDPAYAFLEGYINSFIITIPSTILPIFLAALAAYGFARFSFPIKTSLFLVLLLIMAVPQQMVVIPLYFMLRNVHLINTFLGLILIHSSWGLAWITFFMHNFFQMLPKEIEEAAKVDGAGYFTIFFTIVLRLSLPALLSASVIQFTWVWSDFFFALMFLISPEKYVVTQKVAYIKGEYHIDWGLLSAGSVLTMLVPLLLYTFLQKYFIRGMVGWTIKG